MKLLCAAPAVIMLAVASSAFADGDAVAGAVVFRKCGACHTATASENRVGPSLMGVVGRPVASAPNYAYSPAMKAFGADGKVWDDALLRKYLPGPQFLVKGTRMTFPGLKSERDLDNLIAYLKNPVVAQ
ncbi:MULTISPECIES: cytochrome c family protein [unclassified Rhizobium]|uniref:c-type cytochrome n=1 Tax=unclassified Rhizobium TaxID=2613769 RepID=UPI000EA8BF1E|nr:MULTISPECIES: cytochrome c family protein [unclassified Rhizobium]AYG66903.1 cytochrome c family protein [Rhizobium sp. CCGE531]AYG73283.1 cytochrome c family protein [Rhizobium sp. CCGE532]